MSLFKTNVTKNYSKQARFNYVYGAQENLRKLTMKKQSEDKTSQKIEGWITRDNNNFFEQDEG